jgi:uncharacterized protein YjiS (DUF1127 family)/SAM-dependent methyltransferase
MSVEGLEFVERFLRSLAKLVSRWWQQATTEHELQWLSGRDLADIGIARDDIRKVARERASLDCDPERTRTIARHKIRPIDVSVLDPLANPLADRSSTRFCAAETRIQEKYAMHEDGVFDEMVAACYDDDDAISAPEVVDPIVDLLAEFAEVGRALEFAVGTGRLALPLARRGVDVEGIELSRAMVSRLRAKEGGDALPVAIGDMTTTRVEGHFSLVYLAFNTINNLTTQDAQVACFQNAATHLEPDGYFLVEVGVPPLQRLPAGETFLAFAHDDTHWGIDKFDVVSQNFSSHHIWLRDGSCRRLTVPFRYVWPAELDLMARLAGMELRHRWGGWKEEPFSSVSKKHVSVWQKTHV